jgi:hypothetical protein
MSGRKVLYWTGIVATALALSVAAAGGWICLQEALR